MHARFPVGTARANGGLCQVDATPIRTWVGRGPQVTRWLRGVGSRHAKESSLHRHPNTHGARRKFRPCIRVKRRQSRACCPRSTSPCPTPGPGSKPARPRAAHAAAHDAATPDVAVQHTPPSLPRTRQRCRPERGAKPLKLQSRAIRATDFIAFLLHRFGRAPQGDRREDSCVRLVS